MFGRGLAGTCVALLLVCTAPSRALTQQDSVPTYRLRLLGVYDDQSGDPVAGVRVADVMGGTSTITGNTGTISLFFLSEGTSIVRLQKVGYEPQTLTVTISPTETTPLTLVMHRVIQLPTVVTTDVSTHVPASLVGFASREHSAKTGYFVDDSILRKSENLSLADVLKNRTPGVKIAYKQGSVFLAPSTRCMDGTKAGPPQVYVDGVAQSLEGIGKANTDPYDLSRFQVSDLAGIEWYPDASMIPVEIARPADRCGALFLWTRPY